jgi:hypothetical protein
MLPLERWWELLLGSILLCSLSGLRSELDDTLFVCWRFTTRLLKGLRFPLRFGACSLLVLPSLDVGIDGSRHAA